MFTILLLMMAGIGTGYLFRRFNFTFLPKIITLLIWVLLFLLGVDTGSNEMIMSSLHTIGLEALVLTLAGVAGSAICAKLLWSLINKEKEETR
ncbi:MAG: LysO family transporter [Bacteroidales bacterium]